VTDNITSPSSIPVRTELLSRLGDGYFEVEMKKCYKCKEAKDPSEFYKNKTTKDGLRIPCKVCVKIYQEDNKDKIKAYKKEYLKNNPDYTKNWFKNNREKAIGYAKRSKEKDPQKDKARHTLRNAVSSGRVLQCPCSVCGTEEDVHGHHWSYEKEHWLNVTWLCRKHHSEEHEKIRAIQDFEKKGS